MVESVCGGGSIGVYAVAEECGYIMNGLVRAGAGAGPTPPRPVAGQP